MNTLTLMLELVRFIPLLFVIGYAAYSDYKTGEVPNKVWLYTIIGGLLTALETAIFFSIPLLLFNLLVIGFCVGIGFLMFHLGGGGADSKAFMTIGISAPLFPLWSFLWPIPLPFVVMFIAAILAVPALINQKSSVPIWQRKLRFLPFVFIGLIMSVIL